MRKALTITLVAALALIVSGAAYANYCARDVVPASTILVPFARQGWTFVDDPSNDGTLTDEYGSPDYSGYVTQLAVTNVSSDAQIIHITVWSPTSVALLDFDEVLSGYDVWTINFRDMLANHPDIYKTSTSATWKANVDLTPLPAFAGPDKPSAATRDDPWEWGPDGRTSFGTNPTSLDDPQPTNELPTTGCFLNLTQYPPYNFELLIAGLEIEVANRQHFGCDTDGDGDADLNVRTEFNDTWVEHIADSRIADKTGELWFYVTVDVVNFCNVDFPSTNGYFSATYSNVNVLIGDIIYLNETDKYSEAISAVHIESEEDNSIGENFYEEKAFFEPAGDDERPFVYLEPLATAFAFRYGNSATIASNVMMWKNRHQIRSLDGDVNDCGDYIYFSWDMDEHHLSRLVEDCPVSPCYTVEGYDPNIFPFETQMVAMTTKNFDLPDAFGWILVVFYPSYGESATPDPTGGAVPMATQAWAGVQFTFGDYSAAMEAATLANANCFIDEVLPVLNMDAANRTE